MQNGNTKCHKVKPYVRYFYLIIKSGRKALLFYIYLDPRLLYKHFKAMSFYILKVEVIRIVKLANLGLKEKSE